VGGCGDVGFDVWEDWASGSIQPVIFLKFQNMEFKKLNPSQWLSEALPQLKFICFLECVLLLQSFTLSVLDAAR
jgi:hypothetical protein